MISIKRTFATLLLFAFCIVFTPQIANSIPLTTNEDSLHDFLQNTKEIKAVFDYPSMEKTTNIAGKTKLAAHTPIAIRCTETISTKDIVSGGVVKFAVVSDIMSSNGSVLVKAGTPVTAQISFAKSIPFWRFVSLTFRKIFISKEDISISFSTLISEHALFVIATYCFPKLSADKLFTNATSVIISLKKLSIT